MEHIVLASIKMSTSHTSSSPRRFHQVIRLKPSEATEYKRLHASIPAPVADAIKTANIVDYSIAYDADLGLLFARFTYKGSDLDVDMATMQGNGEVRKWWSTTDPMQVSLRG